MTAEARHRPPSPETLRKHGITEEMWVDLYEYQEGLCGVCREEHPEYVIDHDHKRGAQRVRGLVGRMCNRHLGQIRDSVAWARGAAEYLEHPPTERLDSFRDAVYPVPTKRRRPAPRARRPL